MSSPGAASLTDLPPSLSTSSAGSLRRASTIDLTLLLTAAVFTFAAGARFELHEVFSRWATGYERWQLDELPATLFVLACGWAWFALRRWRDARREIDYRERAERELLQLHARNRELAQQLLAAQEAERRAHARDLRDQLARHCDTIQTEAARVHDRLRRNAKAPPELGTAAARIAGAAQALHRLIHDLPQRLQPALGDARDEAARLASLTPRELEVFRLLAEGKSAAQCARALGIRTKTVANHQTLIKEKLGVATPAAFVHLALRHRLISPSHA